MAEPAGHASRWSSDLKVSSRNRSDYDQHDTYASGRSSAFESRQDTKSGDDAHESSNSFTLGVGEASPKGMEFVAFKLIKKYPYLYVGTTNGAEVGTYFKVCLLNKTYVWDFAQFEHFLKIANVKLYKNLRIPHGGARDKFFLTFGSSDTPVPRFLGRAGNEKALQIIQRSIYGFPQDKLSDLSPAVLQSYKDSMDEIYNSFTSRKKKNPEEVKMKQVERQKNLGRVTKRVQRYLGLRARAAYVSQSASKAAGWNVEEPAPFIKDSSVRFVCVDIEAYERNNKLVTEVGLAILDTEDIMDIPPGNDGENWFSQIKTFHFRINEYSHLVNSEFVAGCPYAFNFGQSELIPLKSIAQRISDIIGDGDSEDKRPVILVGHGMGQDLTYLHKLGYNVWRVPQIQDEVDTSSMYQRLEQAQHGRGLETMCRELNHPGYDFHNAGNDAYFTLQSMIVMAFRQMLNPPNNTSESAEDPGGKEWSDGERDDGGPPQKSQEPVQKDPRPTGTWHLRM
ncbi:putative qde-2-interacting protein [Eutypa lata UCREL1]|uniref:Putative qde-2-interacting protein n=1 Tax=Eutypa lata (strain UCR-EL1) TaxID=1287681 RepID=M7SPI4_EUTLA|nr:putative qde-2-interacting protein [Eutypa lata UCREL1]